MCVSAELLSVTRCTASLEVNRDCRRLRRRRCTVRPSSRADDHARARPRTTATVAFYGKRFEWLRSKPDKRASENARFRRCDRADAPVVTALGPHDVTSDGESQCTLFSSGVRFAATHRAVANAIEPSIHFI